MEIGIMFRHTFGHIDPCYVAKRLVRQRVFILETYITVCKPIRIKAKYSSPSFLTTFPLDFVVPLLVPVF